MYNLTDRLLIFSQFCKDHHVNFNYRVSCKVKNNLTDINRHTFITDLKDTYFIRQLIFTLCEGCENIQETVENFLLKILPEHSFILSLGLEGNNFYLDRNHLKGGKMTCLDINRAKAKECIYEIKFDTHPLNFPLKAFLRSDYYLLREDGQVYLKFKDGVEEEVKAIFLDMDIPQEMKEWICCQKGQLRWLQISEGSISVYYSSKFFI